MEKNNKDIENFHSRHGDFLSVSFFLSLFDLNFKHVLEITGLNEMWQSHEILGTWFVFYWTLLTGIFKSSHFQRQRFIWDCKTSMLWWRLRMNIHYDIISLARFLFLRFQQLSIAIWIEKHWDDCVLKYMIIKSCVLLLLPRQKMVFVEF